MVCGNEAEMLMEAPKEPNQRLRKTKRENLKEKRVIP